MTIHLTPGYADIRDDVTFWSSRFGALLFDNLEIRGGVRGLDVACASGFPLLELAWAHGPSSHFVGIDIWKEALDRARRRIEFYQLSNVEVHEADASSMPFPNESFDLVTSNLGINNFEDVDGAMAECHRVARPGARIALTTNLTGHLASFYDLFRQTLREHGRADLVPALDAQEAHRGTRTTVEQMLLRSGFTVSRVVEDEFFLPFADGTAFFRHHLVQFFIDGWRGVTDDPAIYAALEAKLNAASPLRMRIPMLYAEGVRR